MEYEFVFGKSFKLVSPSKTPRTWWLVLSSVLILHLVRNGIFWCIIGTNHFQGTWDTTISSATFKQVECVPHDPMMWFATSVLLLESRRIVNHLRLFTYLLESFSAYVIVSLRGLVISPPKSLLQRCLSLRQKLLRQPLGGQFNGDMKPRHHLVHLGPLAGSNDRDSETVWKLWLESLLVHIHFFVTSLIEDWSLNRAAVVADTIGARADRGLIPSLPLHRAVVRMSIEANHWRGTHFSIRP